MSSVMPESLAEGRFQLLEVIGEGGMATVYRAFDQRLQRPRAIKVLSPALAGRPALRRRFMTEAQTMATLEESRVVRVFDVAEEGDRCYIVMELVEGGSLLDRIRDYGPLPPRLAAKVGLQLCESLQAAHDAGVIHRDIKPHNILLTRSGEIRITDFGIAQVQQEGDNGLTKTGAVMGTWGFMAPEQKSDAKNVDARADLYSVGATLWSTLRGDTPPELFMADQESAMLDGIPDALAEVIRRATRYRREERYPSVRAMADSIRALQGLLPEDPEDTPPLVSTRVVSREGRLDTIDQFRTPAPQPSMGTMVPDVAELPPPVSLPHPPGLLPPSLPPRLEARPAAGATGVDLSFSSEAVGPDKPARRDKPDRRWMLYSGIGIMGLGLAAVIVVGKVWNPIAGTGEQAALPAAATDADAVAMAEPPAPGAVGTPEPAPTPVASAPTTQALQPTGSGSFPAPAAGAPAPQATSVAATTPASPAASPTASPTDAAAVPVTTLVAPTGEAAAEAPTVKATPKAPPKLVIDAPAQVNVGATATFTATLAPGYSVKLYFRSASGGAFRDRTMSESGSTYTTSIKIDESMGGGLDYFVAATDSRNNTLRDGSALSPRRVTVTP